MQLHAVTSIWALCNITVSFRLKKTQGPGAYGCASPWPPPRDTHHRAQEPPLPDPLLALLWHARVCCWAVTWATITDCFEKYFLFSLTMAHLVHARVLLHMGRSNRKSPQSKHGRNTAVQSWVRQTRYVALTSLVECLAVLRAFPTTWGLVADAFSIRKPR